MRQRIPARRKLAVRTSPAELSTSALMKCAGSLITDALSARSQLLYRQWAAASRVFKGPVGGATLICAAANVERTEQGRGAADSVHEVYDASNRRTGKSKRRSFFHFLCFLLSLCLRSRQFCKSVSFCSFSARPCYTLYLFCFLICYIPNVLGHKV